MRMARASHTYSTLRHRIPPQVYNRGGSRETGCRACLHAPAAGPRPPSPCRVGRLRWADNGKELLDRDLLPECLFILQPRAAWSETFDAGWSGARAEEWGAHNAHAKLTPETVTKGGGAYALWRCGRAGHMWTALVKSRGSLGTGCRASHNIHTPHHRTTPHNKKIFT